MPVGTRRSLLFTGCLLVLVFLASERNAGAAGGSASDSWKTVRVSAAGISVEYPRSWQLFRSDAAFSASGDQGRHLMVNVIPGVRFPSSLDEFTSKVKAGFNKDNQTGFAILNTAAVKVNGTTGYRDDLREASERVGDLFIPHNGGVTAVSVQAPDDAASTRLIAHVLRSVRRI